MDRNITIKRVQEAKMTKKAINLVNMPINPKTGKKSARSLTFSDAHWGKATRSYMHSIKTALNHDKLKAIFENAKQYTIAVRQGGESSQTEQDELGDRAFLAKGTDATDDASQEV